MGVTVSSSHVGSVAPSFSGRTPHAPPAPAWGLFHGRRFCTSCPSVGLSHRVQSFRSRLLQRGSPTGSKVLPANLFHHGLLSPRVCRSCCELLLQVLPELQVEICSTMDLHGLQGNSLPHHGLLHGLQGNLCSGAWSTSSPPSALTLGSAGVFHIFSILSPATVAVAQQLFPLLKYVIPEALPPSLTGLALASSVHLGASWHWLCRTKGKLLTASHRSCSPSATKTLLREPITAACFLRPL